LLERFEGLKRDYELLHSCTNIDTTNTPGAKSFSMLQVQSESIQKLVAGIDETTSQIKSIIGDMLPSAIKPISPSPELETIHEHEEDDNDDPAEFETADKLPLRSDSLDNLAQQLKHGSQISANESFVEPSVDLQRAANTGEVDDDWKRSFMDILDQL
jgi:hypothetical protein